MPIIHGFIERLHGQLPPGKEQREGL
jgi:hypothetical protein